MTKADRKVLEAAAVERLQVLQKRIANRVITQSLASIRQLNAALRVLQ